MNKFFLKKFHSRILFSHIFFWIIISTKILQLFFPFNYERTWHLFLFSSNFNSSFRLLNWYESHMTVNWLKQKRCCSLLLSLSLALSRLTRCHTQREKVECRGNLNYRTFAKLCSQGCKFIPKILQRHHDHFVLQIIKRIFNLKYIRTSRIVHNICSRLFLV